MATPTPPARPSTYADAAAAELWNVFGRIGPDFVALAQAVVAGNYNTAEGRIADAVRMCELGSALVAILRTVQALKQPIPAGH